MVTTNTPTRPAATGRQADLIDQLSGVSLSTRFDTAGAEPIQFLETVSRLSHSDSGDVAGGPTAQDIECLRQAAWKYQRQTAMPVATGQDLVDVLGKLGYV